MPPPATAARPGYAIGHITVRDPVVWQTYCAAVPATLEPWDAEIVFRGKRHAVYSGTHPATDTVVIRFPSLAAVDGWQASAAYQAIVPLREAAADVTLLAFET